METTPRSPAAMILKNRLRELLEKARRYVRSIQHDAPRSERAGGHPGVPERELGDYVPRLNIALTQRRFLNASRNDGSSSPACALALIHLEASGRRILRMGGVSPQYWGAMRSKFDKTLQRKAVRSIRASELDSESQNGGPG